MITNSKKRRHQGKLISSFCNGSRRLYDFVDDNPVVNFLDISYVNNPAVVSEQPKMTAINSCIEIDLTGQVVSDSIGGRMFSGVGGQVHISLITQQTQQQQLICIERLTLFEERHFAQTADPSLPFHHAPTRELLASLLS